MGPLSLDEGLVRELGYQERQVSPRLFGDPSAGPDRDCGGVDGGDISRANAAKLVLGWIRDAVWSSGRNAGGERWRWATHSRSDPDSAGRRTILHGPGLRVLRQQLEAPPAPSTFMPPSGNAAGKSGARTEAE